MSTLVAIGYPDQGTAEQARHTVQELESELIIQADLVISASTRCRSRSRNVHLALAAATGRETQVGSGG